MKKIIRNKHDLLVGSSEDINLENLIFKKEFNVPINGSFKKSYQTMYEQSKSQKANVAVIQEKSNHTLKGSFYSSAGNPFNNLIKSGDSLDYTSNDYVLLKRF